MEDQGLDVVEKLLGAVPTGVIESVTAKRVLNLEPSFWFSDLLSELVPFKGIIQVSKTPMCKQSIHTMTFMLPLKVI